MLVVKKVNILCIWIQIIYVVVQWVNIYHIVKWLNKKEIDRFDVNSNECDFIEENSLNGYIIKVDLEYPDELHELQNDILSNYCSNIANKYDIKIGVVIKLVPNLGDKSKYILHYGSIHLYLWLGMKLVIFCKILKLKKPAWLKKYIDFNTVKRKKCC